MTVAVQSVRTSYQTPLLLEQTAALKAPPRTNPLFGALRRFQEWFMDVDGCRSSARKYEHEFNDWDTLSDAELKSALADARAAGQHGIANKIERGLFFDDKEREPLGKHWRMFDQAQDAARQGVTSIERLLTPARQRAGKGQVPR
jgi:hypothetical protein